jgi:hypothetical protein
MNLPAVQPPPPAVAVPAPLVLLVVGLATACLKPAPVAITINELQPSNISTIQDEKGSFEDWIELYNSSDQDISLRGWYLTDNLDNPVKAPLSRNISIPAKGFVLLWADGGDVKSPYHLPFSLKASGEEVGLFADWAGDIVRQDWLVFDAVADDWSLARKTDGQDPWIATNVPTPAAANADSGEADSGTR